MVLGGYACHRSCVYQHCPLSYLILARVFSVYCESRVDTVDCLSMLMSLLCLIDVDNVVVLTLVGSKWVGVTSSAE
eukprot:3693210-Amphidinium_carterae.2